MVDFHWPKTIWRWYFHLSNAKLLLVGKLLADSKLFLLGQLLADSKLLLVTKHLVDSNLSINSNSTNFTYLTYLPYLTINEKLEWQQSWIYWDNAFRGNMEARLYVLDRDRSVQILGLISRLTRMQMNLVMLIACLCRGATGLRHQVNIIGNIDRYHSLQH